jgi:imidazolonepropionase
MKRPLRVLAERLVCCTGSGLGVIEHAFLDVEGGLVARIGPRSEAPEALPTAVVLEAELVTPGLCDAHTHAAWAGSRHNEYALRMAGADYEAIAKAGGGIVSSMRAVRAIAEEQLVEQLVARLRRMVALGVTSFEIKSGYGLDLASERKQLRAIRTAQARLRQLTLVPTFLGLHAVPPEAAGDRDGYARTVTEESYPALAEEGLFRFVDAYLDRAAFSVAQARTLCERARRDGFGLRLHIGQFADVGGAEFAAELGALSVDHAEHVSQAGLAALAAAGVRVGLLPVASFTLRGPTPAIDELRKHGLRMVVASDANPGTAPTESLPLALAFAVRNYGLSVTEALRGATVEAALSLDLKSHGQLSVGARADLVLWDLPHEDALAQPFGLSKALTVIAGGEVVHSLQAASGG